MSGEIRSKLPGKLKKLQRKTALKRRTALSEEKRKEYSRRICENIINSGSYKEADSIMLYRAFGTEANLSVLEEQAKKDGKKLIYPYCTDGEHMLAVHPKSGCKWVSGRYGIDTPDITMCETVNGEDIDLVICPCSAFDEEFSRLGMGKGYYDRFLPKCKNAGLMLAAFETQKLPKICIDRHDIKMHAYVTEECIRKK